MVDIEPFRKWTGESPWDLAEGEVWAWEEDLRRPTYPEYGDAKAQAKQCLDEWMRAAGMVAW